MDRRGSAGGRGQEREIGNRMCYWLGVTVTGVTAAGTADAAVVVTPAAILLLLLAMLLLLQLLLLLLLLLLLHFRSSMQWKTRCSIQTPKSALFPFFPCSLISLFLITLPLLFPS